MIKLYKKSAIQPMRPYVPGEDMEGISVSKEDTPELGGMIAVNPKNNEDRWYVDKQFFEKNYRELEAVGTFSDALCWLKEGKKVQRVGWNGKGVFIFLVPGSVFKVNRPPLLGIYEEGTEICYHSHIDMKTADNKVVPWLASQTDMLANDWQIVDAI